MSVPTVTRLADGQLRLDWPDGLRSTEVAREVFEQMVTDLNQLRAENEQLQSSVDEAHKVIGLAIALHPDRCTPRDGRPMDAWCTWCSVLEPFREPA